MPSHSRNGMHSFENFPDLQTVLHDDACQLHLMAKSQKHGSASGAHVELVSINSSSLLPFAEVVSSSLKVFFHAAKS